MYKIGGISLDVSHPKTFAMNLEQHNIPMRYEYIYNDGFRTDREVEWFIKRFGLKGRASSIQEMVRETDIGFVQSCNWEKHIPQAMPYLEEGKPVFIDKPIVGSYQDIIQIEALAKQGARIFGSSSLRYCKEIKEFLARPKVERGEVIGLFGTSGVDEFNYAIHIAEAFSALAESMGESASYLGTSERNGGQYEFYSFTYENGIRAVYSSCLTAWQPFHITVMTTTGTFSFVVDIEDIYRSLLCEVYEGLAFFQQSLANIEVLTNCSRMMLCAKKSREERNGGKVHCGELCEVDRYDGFLFEEAYRKTAGDIYKD